MAIGDFIEYGVELGYGIVFLVLAISTILKYRETQNELAKYFFIAFLLLAASGLYGGISGLLSISGYSNIPIIGVKVLEVYQGLILGALVFFLIGLIKV